MARIGDLNIRIGATIDGLRRGLQQAERSLQRSSRRMSDLGTRLTFTATASIGALGVSAVQTAAEFETLQNSLNILTGSAEEGAKAFERLKNFAGNTPLDLQDLMRANNTLMGFGLTADDAFNSFKQLGDISAVVGGDLQRIAVAYGQSIAANRVDARDILQFINNGVPIMEMLAEAMGVAVSEVKQLASEGKVTGDVLRKAMTMATAEGGKFYKGLETASQTLSGKFQKLKDNISLALNEIGQSIAEAINLREVIDTLIKAVASLADGFKNLPDGVKKAIVIFAGFVAAVGPVLVAVASFKALLAGLASSFAGLLAISASTVLAVAAIGAVITSIVKLRSEYNKTVGLSKVVSKEIEKNAASYLKEKASIDKLLVASNNMALSIDKRQGAYNELVKNYPDYFKAMDIEQGKVVDTTSIYDELIAKIKEVARQQAISAQLVELEQRKLDLEIQISAEFPGMSLKEIQENINAIAKESNDTFGKRFKNNLKETLQTLGLMDKDWLSFENDLDEINALNKEINRLSKLGATTQIADDGKKKGLGGGGQGVEETEFSKILSKYKQDSRALNNLRIDRLIDEDQYNKDYLALQRSFLVQLSQAGLSGTDLYKQIFEKYASMRKAALAEIKAIDSADFEIIPLSILKESGKRAGEAYAKAIKEGVARVDAVGEAFGAIGSFDQLDGFTNLFNGMQGLLEDTAKFGELSFYNMWKAFSSDANKAVQTTAQALAGITQGISSIISTAVSRDLESLDVSLQKQMKAIDQLNISEDAKQKHRLRAEERYNKQVAQLKAKQFRADKAAAIAQAAMNTAVGITQLIASGVGTALIPVVAALGSAQIAAIASQPVPQFANGGIVNGRTLAEVGEYGSAARGNPEVIAPLNKLKSMLGDMGGGNITGEFRLRGDDLVAAVEQANRKTARFSGTTQF